jgi:hypothetical protein
MFNIILFVMCLHERIITACQFFVITHKGLVSDSAIDITPGLPLT